MTTKWIVRQQRKSQARIRLICFPFAGGAASAFHSWSEGLSSEIEVCAVQLPGRETRLAEPLLSCVSEFVQEARATICGLFDMPVAFFGHSMGALLAYSIAQELDGEHHSMLRHLMVSARRAPHLPDTRPKLHEKPHDEFMEALRNLDGTPPEILANRELMELLLPIFRADFGICENYEHTSNRKLNCGLTSYGGTSDDISQEDIEAWRIHTTGHFASRMFDGGHFYLNAQRGQLLRHVNETLLSLVQ